MAVAAFSTASLAQAPQLRTDNIDEILNAMTLREKATLLVGELAANQNAQGTQIGNTEKYIPGAAGNTHSIPRLGIPPTVMADGPAGLRIYTKRNYDSNTYNCTGFLSGQVLQLLGMKTLYIVPLKPWETKYSNMAWMYFWLPVTISNEILSAAATSSISPKILSLVEI